MSSLVKNLTAMAPCLIAHSYVFLSAEFLARSLEKIKQRHYQLNMETLEVGKTAEPRKKVGDLRWRLFDSMLDDIAFSSAFPAFKIIVDAFCFP